MTTPTSTEVKGFQLSDASYNKLKPIVQIVLPAVATLYFTLSSIWGFPSTEQVVGTIAAITTFLGVVLGISARSYRAASDRFDGDITVAVGENGVKTYSLALYDDPENLDLRDTVTFKILVD